ncbi:MAG: HAD family phosphatase [Nitriliruptoraceae bacterium]
MFNDPFVRPALFCLDFDGTLVDTRPLWEAAYIHVAAGRKHQLPADWWARIAGKSMDASATVFGVHDPLEQKTVSRDLVATALSFTASYPPLVLPGATELFVRARQAKVDCCIVTSTWTELATTLALAAGFPQVNVIGGDQVTAGKPAPDIYLKAAKQHAVNPTACLAVEDSPTGVASAYTAGLCVYALGDHVITDPLRQRSIRMLDAVRFSASVG